MVITIVIAIFSLMGLVVLHELGHFLLAKKFGVKVEEFGIGLPPRIIGKKFGDTVYSLNLLPVGAFVRLFGEEKRSKESKSFSGKPVWQRALIVASGVITFWLVTFVILSVLGATLGIPSAVDDQDRQNLKNPVVQITAVAKNSPAELAGLKAGDIIEELKTQNSKFKIAKVSELQGLTEEYKGQEITLTIQRGKEIFGVPLTPRVSPPTGEGQIGVGLARVAFLVYPWHKAPLGGALLTARITGDVFIGFGKIIANLTKGQGVPAGFQAVGPIGIFDQLKNAFGMGLNYFLYFVAVISVYLAIFNILPIPAVDGGRLIFLGIEALAKKPVPEKLEKGVICVSFFILIGLVLFVSFKDITRIIQ
ncbi:MAG: M50 family metallopeptidase [bacterium]